MDNLRIVLADLDEAYIERLEKPFVSGYENAEVILITEKAYSDEFFSSPQTIDILVISEELLPADMDIHNISNVFVLCESNAITQILEDVNPIYKSANVLEIFKEIRNTSVIKSSKESVHKTKLVTFYSPIGGIGATSLAGAVCAALNASGKRTLFIAVDGLQNFKHIISDSTPIAAEAESAMRAMDNSSYEVVKKYIRTESFSYIPPFAHALNALNILPEHYFSLIEDIRSTDDYDYIIIDTPCEFSNNISTLMGMSDKVVIVAGQDSSSALKMHSLTKDIDYSDASRFIFVCNKFERRTESFIDGSLPISEYIPMLYESDISNISFYENLSRLL